MVVAVLCLIPAGFGFLSYRTRSIWFTAALLLCSFASNWLAGPTPGSLVCGLSAIISAGIFLSWRAAVIAWLVSCVSVAGGLLLLHGNYWTYYNPSIMDPRKLSVVVRFSVTYVALSSFLTLGVTFVIQRLARSLRETKLALEEARTAQRAAETAWDSREQAVTSLVEAQRLGMIGKLSAQIAHDFNNSLQVILGYGWQLEQGELSEEETKEGARDILDICGEASQLSHQLLSLGQRVEMELQALCISDELKSIQKSLRRIVPRNIEFVTSSSAPHACVMGDVVRIRQAVYNLCINAIHAMSDGGRLTLEISSQGNEVFVDVSDTGTGIDDETARKIFEPYFTTKGVAGTGLGLVTVREIMRAFGGAVDLDSEPGKGARFRLRFPLIESDGIHSGVTLAVLRLPQQRVLVVDDDFRVRQALSRMLEAAGAQVVAVSNVSEALDVLATERFEVVCVEAVLPGLPTCDLIRFVKKTFPAMVVLVCSAHVEEDLLRRGIASGEISYLATPVSQERLIRKLHQLLERGKEVSEAS
jgi:signal transduction histidine kinase/ActR/RegA family two-component response regulator